MEGKNIDYQKYIKEFMDLFHSNPYIERKYDEKATEDGAKHCLSFGLNTAVVSHTLPFCIIEDWYVPN